MILLADPDALWSSLSTLTCIIPQISWWHAVWHSWGKWQISSSAAGTQRHLSSWQKHTWSRSRGGKKSLHRVSVQTMHVGFISSNSGRLQYNCLCLSYVSQLPFDSIREIGISRKLFVWPVLNEMNHAQELPFFLCYLQRLYEEDQIWTSML